jgi:adenosylmethionine-8-amino-7-oxononanoate aminotransferase
MCSVRSDELVLERGEDVWLYDTDGRRYLDGTASLWYANVGHGREEIRRAVTAQMEKLETYTIFNDFANPPALELAERLAELAPIKSSRVIFGSGGGDAIDTAAKLARLYWSANGATDRLHLISRHHGYHGTHGYGTGLAGIAANREGWGPLVGATSCVEHDSVMALEAEIERLGPDRVAAFFVEPIMGAGGVLLPPEGYLPGVAEVCRRHGVLLVVDEVICGFGRLGTWFGIERWGLEPDMIVFAKGVTSGYLPLGGLVVSDRVAAPFWDRPGLVRHGPTFAGHASCCAAGLANLDLLSAGGLLERGKQLEQPLAEALAVLVDHSAVAEVRAGTGLIAAVELAPDLLAALPGAPFELFRAVREHGVLVRPLGSTIAVSPPLTVEDEHLALLAEAIAAGLGDLLAVPGPRASSTEGPHLAG